MASRIKGRKAWLITWDWAGDHAAVPEDDIIAAILHPLTSPKNVQHIMEVLYASREYLPADKLQSLHHNPYPATFNTVNVEQKLIGGEIWHQKVPQQAQIFCGHNPWLYARCVDELRLKNPLDPDSGLVWKEREYPKTIRYSLESNG